MATIIDLTDALTAAGIPNTGVTRDQFGVVTVLFTKDATPQQKTQAAAIVAATDLTPKTPRAVASIMQDIANLSAQDVVKLTRLALADFLLRYPNAAKRLNINISGEE